jgi:hypothetical protein
MTGTTTAVDPEKAGAGRVTTVVALTVPVAGAVGAGRLGLLGRGAAPGPVALGTTVVEADAGLNPERGGGVNAGEEKPVAGTAGALKTEEVSAGATAGRPPGAEKKLGTGAEVGATAVPAGGSSEGLPAKAEPRASSALSSFS